MKQAIGIKFSDNDFYHTLTAFMELLSKVDGVYSLDKKKIAFMFNELAFGLYCSFQNKFEYNGLEKFDKNYIEHTKKYLTIEEDDVLFGEQALEKLMEWNNSEYHVITPSGIFVS